MQTPNISTPIASQSAKMHNAKQKMLFLLFLLTEKKRKTNFQPLPQLRCSLKCLLRFSGLWVMLTEEKMQGNQCQNWKL